MKQYCPGDSGQMNMQRGTTALRSTWFLFCNRVLPLNRFLSGKRLLNSSEELVEASKVVPHLGSREIFRMKLSNKKTFDNPVELMNYVWHISTNNRGKDLPDLKQKWPMTAENRQTFKPTDRRPDTFWGDCDFVCINCVYHHNCANNGCRHGTAHNLGCSLRR